MGEHRTAILLKLVESRELEIDSFLNSIKSPDNHTVPVLYEVMLEMKAVLVMPILFSQTWRTRVSKTLAIILRLNS